MGLKKFRKIRVQDEEYVNVSVVYNNYSRINHENEQFNSPFSCVTNPRCTDMDSEQND